MHSTQGAAAVSRKRPRFQRRLQQMNGSGAQTRSPSSARPGAPQALKTQRLRLRHPRPELCFVDPPCSDRLFQDQCRPG